MTKFVKAAKHTRSGAIGSAPVRAPTRFVDRDLCGKSPKADQFEPTESQPIRQHHRMAGIAK